MPINSAKKILLSLFPLTLEGNGSRVRVTIKDEGIGLQEEDIANLFTRFYQGKHSFQGNGIGLSYAKQLVEMHGASSEPKIMKPKERLLFHITV